MKKILIVILLMIPLVINAKECDKEKHKNFTNLSSGITYDNNYSKGNNAFTVTIYNVFDEMYVIYNEKKYKPTSESTIVINKIPPGTKLNIEIYGNDDCGPIKTLVINEPYFNKYYGSTMCKGYEGILLMCSSQFTSTEVTKSLLEKSIYNYTHNISSKTKNDDPGEGNPSFFGQLTTFFTKWGIKITLAVVSTIFSIVLFSDKLRKVKHGI